MEAFVNRREGRLRPSVCLSVRRQTCWLLASALGRLCPSPLLVPCVACVCVFVGCFFFCSDGYACRSKKQEESGGSVVFVAKGQECRRFLGKREEAL